MSRTRSFFFTHWDPETDLYDVILKTGPKYFFIGKHLGLKSGKWHLHGYINYTNPRTWNTVKTKIPVSDIQHAKGSASEAKEYVLDPNKKGELLVEFGEIPIQGKRTDLLLLKDKISKGELTVNDIVLDNPYSYHIYGRTLNKVEDLYLQTVQRTEMTKGIWYFGKSGTGKSYRCLHNYHPDTHYVVPNDNGWWDGYKQQPIVVFNEFRGNIKFSELLELVDIWPKTVKRRNREPMPFTSKTVMITSSLAPEDIYLNKLHQKDNFSQFTRRFKVFETIDWSTEVEHRVILKPMFTSSSTFADI